MSKRKKGQTSASASPFAPRPTVMGLMQQYPHHNKEGIIAKAINLVKDDPDKYLDVWLYYAAENAWNWCDEQEKAGKDTARRPPHAAPAFGHGHPPLDPIEAIKARHADELARVERSQKTIAGVTQILLLDLKAPNGKPYRDCTKVEMEQFGTWQLTLSKRMKSGQTVGAAFTEAELRRAQTWKD